MSNAQPQWQDVEVPQGAFIGWGEKGQTIVGRVLSFSVEGGTDFNGNKCPQMVLELTGDAVNYKDKGTTKETIASGEMVTITAGQANLRNNLLAALPSTDDLISIRYDDDYKTANGTGKSFKVQIARGHFTSAGVDVDAF